MKTRSSKGRPGLLAALIAAVSAAPVRTAEAGPAMDQLLSIAQYAGTAQQAAPPASGPSRPVNGLSWNGVSGNDRGVDLSSQFTGPSRNQRDVGSCHAFAAVGVLEAAYYRRYGQRVRLSEADLFLRRNILSGDAYDTFRQGGGEATLDEGHYIEGTIRFALDTGVATGPRYGAFLERYRRYRAAEARTLEDLLRQYERLGAEERAGYDVRQHWYELQTSTLSRRIAENYLTGNDRTLQADRDLIKQRFAGMRMDFRSFTPASSADQEACRRAGQGQTDFMLGELRAGRPVAISQQGHAYIVSGYRVDENGAAVFMTRNSYGEGENNDIQANETCTIRKVISVVE